MTKIAASQRQQVADLCMAGATRAEVATQYGVTEACITAILRNMGIKLRYVRTAIAPRVSPVLTRYLSMAEMYQSGKSQAEVAESFGVTSGCVSLALKKLGVPVRTGPGKIGAYKRKIPASEYGSIAEQYKSGVTLEEISSQYGASRERVRQILAESFGMSKIDGGGAIRAFKNTGAKVEVARARNERREAYWRAKWGMSLDQYHAHVAEFGSSRDKTSPIHKYVQQRNNAKKRGIAWNFTFPEWWKVWQDSGKWEQRALTKHGYVMARYGDGDTPYSAENVYICTQSQNSKDSFIVSPAAERFKNSRAMPGSGLGYSRNKRSKTNPYVAQFRGKNISAFPAPELARAAYLAAAEAYKRSLA